MKQVRYTRGRMSRDRCARGRSSLPGPWSLEASSASHPAGKIFDTPGGREKRACEEAGSVLVVLNNIHSPG
jgi:hypothetical protein